MRSHAAQPEKITAHKQTDVKIRWFLFITRIFTGVHFQSAVCDSENAHQVQQQAYSISPKQNISAALAARGAVSQRKILLPNEEGKTPALAA